MGSNRCSPPCYPRGCHDESGLIISTDLKKGPFLQEDAFACIYAAKRLGRNLECPTITFAGICPTHRVHIGEQVMGWLARRQVQAITPLDFARENTLHAEVDAFWQHFVGNPPQTVWVVAPGGSALRATRLLRRYRPKTAKTLFRPAPTTPATWSPSDLVAWLKLWIKDNRRQRAR